MNLSNIDDENIALDIPEPYQDKRNDELGKNY